jgi:hypothetical protein
MRKSNSMTRRGFLGLLGASSLAAQTILMLRAPARYDYYIDDALGDDGNNGLTPATPWQSLNKLEGLTLVAGATTRVLVKAGTYGKASDYFEITSASTGAVLDITFEPGCVMDGTASNAVSAQNPIFADGGAWTLTLQGNGLTIRNYDNNSGGSPQGLGNGGTNTLIAYDIHIENCIQGISSHVSSVIIMHGGSMTNQVQQAVVPVDTSRVELYGVTVDQSAGSQVLVHLGTGNVTALFEDCIFIPQASGGNSVSVSGGIYRRCRLGTLTARVNLGSAGGVVGTLEDCYVNALINGTCDVDMTRCYGLLTTRLNSNNNITAQHCVFVGGASGQTDSALYRNFDPGSQGTWEFTDCVLTGYTNCVGHGFGPTDAGYFEAAGNFATYINYFNNSTNVDADLLATSADLTTGVITTDPQIGSADSFDQADYAIGPMSPCIGAGSGGGDIGFQA